jgi:hypothetical protein
MFAKFISARSANFILLIIPGRHVSIIIIPQMLLINFLTGLLTKCLLKIYQRVWKVSVRSLLFGVGCEAA